MPAASPYPPRTQATTPHKPMLRLRSWKRADKPGSSLVGFAGIELPFRGSVLKVDDLPVCVSHGKAWAAWPARPVVTKDGVVSKIPGTGKTRYVNILRWSDRDISQRFSDAVVALVRAHDPEAFADQAGPG